MIAYEEGHWGLLFSCSLHGSVLPRGFLWGFLCAILSVALHLLLEEVEDQEVDEKGKNWRDDVASDVLKTFTFAMGFALVMRTQKAYTRWWEGGTLLEQVRGEWFNAVSNLMAFCNPDPKRQAEVERLQHQMVRLFSLLYGNALLQVSTMSNNELDYIDIEGFEAADIDHMRSSPDTCELVLQWIQRIIVDASASELIKIAPPILSRVYNQLGNGIVRLNNARKIRDFPVPFPLAQMVTFMLLIHWMTTVVICAVTINSIAMKAIIAFTVTAPLWGINYMSVELENPFGDDANDLPLRHMQSDMNKSLRCLLQPRTLKVPIYSYNPDKDRKLELKMHDFGASWSGTANKYAFLNKAKKSQKNAQGESKDNNAPKHNGDVEQKAPVDKQIQQDITHMAAPVNFVDQCNPRQGSIERQFPIDLEVECAQLHCSVPVDFMRGVEAHCLHVDKKMNTMCLSDGVPNEEVPQTSAWISYSNRDEGGCRERERSIESVQDWPAEQVIPSTVASHAREISPEQTFSSSRLSSRGIGDHSASCDRGRSIEEDQSRRLRPTAQRLCLGEPSFVYRESRGHRWSSEKAGEKQHGDDIGLSQHVAPTDCFPTELRKHSSCT